MFVIDRVEETLLENVCKIGNLEDEAPVVGQKHTDAAHDIRQIVDVGEHVIRLDDGGRTVGGAKFRGQRSRKELRNGFDAGRRGSGRDVASRIDAEHAAPAFTVKAQERTVVAADFDDKSGGLRRITAAHFVGMATKVLDKAERACRNESVRAEQSSGINHLEQLHVSAVAA